MDNAEQIEFWNGRAADRWVTNQEAMDHALEPFGRAALEAADAKPGERVVDVGCGCGWTSLALAERVGGAGAVLGVDVSAPMLAVAERRVAAVAVTTATFAVGDAAARPFEATFDLVFSRFGVMFFADPTAAFTNLRGALRPGGRVAFVCWGPRAQNPWFHIPMAAAGTVIPLPEPTGPDEPGPFSFGDRARVQRILEGAGFRELAIERSSPDFVLGPDLETATSFAIDSGPVSRLLFDADETTRERVRARVREALVPHLGARGVVLPTSTWVVTARSYG